MRKSWENLKHHDFKHDQPFKCSYSEENPGQYFIMVSCNLYFSSSMGSRAPTLALTWPRTWRVTTAMWRWSSHLTWMMKWRLTVLGKTQINIIVHITLANWTSVLPKPSADVSLAFWSFSLLVNQYAGIFKLIMWPSGILYCDWSNVFRTMTTKQLICLSFRIPHWLPV